MRWIPLERGGAVRLRLVLVPEMEEEESVFSASIPLLHLEISDPVQSDLELSCLAHRGRNQNGFTENRRKRRFSDISGEELLEAQR